MKSCLIAFSACLVAGCIPSYLQKYRNPEPVGSEAKHTTEVQRSAAPPERGSLAAKVVRKSEYTFTQVGKGHFRTSGQVAKVWGSVLKVLMDNYNINIIDRESGIITTEWDSFYVKRQVFRNKVSVFVSRAAGDLVDLKVFNNVERLSDENGKAVWLPSEKEYDETARIVGRVAGLLQPGSASF